MHFKRYISLSILFLAIVSVYTYLNVEELYKIDFFGMNIELPIAVWIILPAILILIASVSHFGFYSFMHIFKRSKLDRDLNKNHMIVKNALLHKSYSANVSDERLKLITDLLENSKLYIDTDYSFNNEELDEVVAAIAKVKSGNYADLSKYKFRKDNEFFIKNQSNRLEIDPSYAEKIVSACTEESELCTKAFEVYVKSAEKRKINKISLKKTKNVVISLLQRYNAVQNQLDFTKDEIIDLCKEVELSQDDFVQIAKILQKNLDPDELLELCFLLQKEIESACSAYLYANLELERNDIAREYLEQFAENELVKFRYYMILKEKGQKVTLSKFV